MNKKYHILYQTTCLVNNKIYIGVHSTNNLDDKYLGSGKLLVRAIKKYGRRKFKVEILKFCDNLNILRQSEKDVVTLDFINNENTYNLVTGGYGIGTIMSDETRAKISATTKNPSFETRLKISKAHRGKFVSAETRAKISKNSKNMSAETRAKISKGSKGRVCTAETRAKISNALLGKPNHTIESRAKISKANKGRIHTTETKIKMSRSAKKRIRFCSYIGTGFKLKSKEYSEYLSKKIIEKWKDPVYREKTTLSLRQICKDPIHIKKISDATKLAMKDPVIRKKCGDSTRGKRIMYNKDLNAHKAVFQKDVDEFIKLGYRLGRNNKRKSKC